MPALQTIYVETEFDIMFIRRVVRDIARSMGFAPSDQARVSLATSSIAHFMDLGIHHHGAISFQTYKGNGKPSRLQVVCTLDDSQPPLESATKGHASLDTLSPPIKGLERIKGLVDDLHIEALPSRGIQITLTKYLLSQSCGGNLGGQQEHARG